MLFNAGVTNPLPRGLLTIYSLEQLVLRFRRPGRLRGALARLSGGLECQQDAGKIGPTLSGQNVRRERVLSAS